MGKQLLVYVIGMSMMISYAMLNMNKTSLDSQDSYALSYGRTMARNIAHAGANIGTQLCLADTGYNTNLIDQPFNGGRYSMYVTKSGDTTRVTSIGHVGMRYYDVASQSWQTQILDTVEAVLRRISFSRYGWFMEKNKNAAGAEIWRYTGDSIFGPVHSNDKWNLKGTPYFSDKVTATYPPKTGTINGVYAPVFANGYQWGVTVQRPAAHLSKLLSMSQSQGGFVNNIQSGTAKDVKLTFLSNGNVAVRIPPTGTAMRNDTVSLATIAPIGIIVVKDADIRVSGTYKGKVTVVALKGSASTKGNVWIESNALVAATNPGTNQSSQDILGIIAERNTMIARDNSRNSSTIVNIQAAIYCQDGEIAVQDYKVIPNHGTIKMYGSMTQNTYGAWNTFNSSGSVVTGFRRHVRFDNRFASMSPPHFPTSSNLKLFAWWEN